ncbi:Flp family type IVb pilin [uncultured Castellaniella sp.]|uniref:Flp family type IVb pilin n=1 Tax=uncultured Castellaniella sp. TaxID=647907 RepID=UPI00261A33F4|nr:Flp family type IVb pilin [uncultured Castellaniella sp.]
MKGMLGALKRDERGVSALEYVILAVIVVAAVAAGGGILRNVITSAFEQTGKTISNCIDNVSTCGDGSGSTTPPPAG